MSFQFWGTTTKGIPQRSTVPDYYEMGSIFFCVSLVIQVLVVITFFYSIIFTFYRAIKNIGQPAIDEIKEISEVEDNNKESGNNEMRPQEDIEGELKREEKILKEMNVKGAFYSQKPELVDIENEDDVVYNFEEDEVPAKKRIQIQQPIKQGKQNKDPTQNKEENNQDQDQSDSESQEQAQQTSQTQQKIQTQQDIATRTRLFKYEDVFFRFAPCCLIPILSVNSLTCSYITVGAFMGAIIMFICFNLLEICSTKHPNYKNIYLVPVLGMFVPFFLSHPSFE